MVTGTKNELTYLYTPLGRNSNTLTSGTIESMEIGC